MKSKMYHGKTVVDAHLPLKLHVKPDDIRAAKRKDPATCAIARCAIRDKYVISARIGQRIALIEYSSHFERYKVNKPSGDAIRQFDKEGIFVEGDYDLMPIPKCLKLSGKAHSSGPSGKSGTATIKRIATRNIYKAKECITA